MIAKNKKIQKSLLIFLILILPVSIYTYVPFTAQSPQQAFAGNTQGGTQGGGNVNPTGTSTGSHNNPHLSTGNASATSSGNSSIAIAIGDPNNATVNGDSSSP